MTNYAKLIADEYTSGNINSYMAERLSKASEFGMTDYLLDFAMDDAKKASKSDVESDEDYNLRFFVLHIADDMLSDTLSTFSRLSKIRCGIPYPVESGVCAAIEPPGC